MRIVVVLWLLVCVFTLPACSLFTSEKTNSTQPKADEGPELIGRIASIPADKRFVLIQSYGTWKSETGTILISRGQGDQTANLLLTGEKLGQFAAADIQSGAVQIGDAVYSQPVPKPVETQPAVPKEPELPENQTKEETEYVQKNN
jgi:hypothetical protein